MPIIYEFECDVTNFEDFCKKFYNLPIKKNRRIVDGEMANPVYAISYDHKNKIVQIVVDDSADLNDLNFIENEINKIGKNIDKIRHDDHRHIPALKPRKKV